MKLYSLINFVTLSNKLSFTKAANRLFISQQALSKSIRNLEKEYNSIFFIRKPKVMLTRSGHIMLEKALQIIEIEKQLKYQLGISEKLCTRVLTIGMGPARSQLILPEVFNDKASPVKLSRVKCTC